MLIPTEHCTISIIGIGQPGKQFAETDDRQDATQDVPHEESAGEEVDWGSAVNDAEVMEEQLHEGIVGIENPDFGSPEEPALEPPPGFVAVVGNATQIEVSADHRQALHEDNCATRQLDETVRICGDQYDLALASDEQPEAIADQIFDNGGFAYNLKKTKKKARRRIAGSSSMGLNICSHKYR